MSSASDKAKFFVKNLSKNSNLDDSGISLPVFPSRTNLKLHNISVTLKMVKKVLTNLDSSMASGPNCIPVVVLNNCEPELSHILAKLLSMCLKESCFPDCWKVSSVVPVFLRILGKGLLLKITAPLVSLWLIKSSKNLQVLGLFITKRNMAFFSDLQYGFRSLINCRFSDSYV